MQGNTELQANLAAISSAKRRIRQPDLSPDLVTHGLEVSKLATAHPKQVAMTPIMKNMLRRFGDIGEEGRLQTDAPETHAEKWLTETCKQLLLKQSKTVHDHYNTSLPLRSVDHYWTDCWLNLDPKKWRDIQPGQIEEVNKMIETYSRPSATVDLPKLLADPVFVKAVEVVLDQLPRVSASREIVEINLPFMTKHTNVGYPYFANDRTTVPNTNQTYAQLTMKKAEALARDPFSIMQYNVTTEFTRFQRGKGRLILAVSRLVNLVLNQLESVEINNYKVKSPLFAGYNDASYLKSVLTQMLNDCEQHGFGMYNIDYHRFDSHVSDDLLDLVGAMSMTKCADTRSAELAAIRAALMSKTWLVAGTLNKINPIYGRIFSGFIDTNRAGGLVNAISITYLVMKQDQHYVRDIVSICRYIMLVMGDDNLLITPPDFNLKRLQLEAKLLGHEIDDATKIAYGPKFLQYRLFEWEGQLVMVYPWTRVLRSMLFKERPSGLGPCGWTLAWYQQLAKLIEMPEALRPVVNIVATFDDNKLMLDKSIDEIIAGTKAEDAEAASKSRGRLDSTARRLYDGDPSKAEQFERGGEALKPGYFSKVQEAIKSVYDPNYLKNEGISVPKEV